VGTIKTLKRLWETKAFDKAIISISTSNQIREKFFNLCKDLLIPLQNAICPSVRINRSVALGEGNVICSLVHIGTCARIGNNNFISSNTTIEHHNVWDSNITTGPSCSTSSRVHVGNNVKMGSGVVIQPGISIGKGSLISSGAVITKSIPEYHSIKSKPTFELMPNKKDYS